MRSGMTLIKINKNSKVQPIYSPRTTYKLIQDNDKKLLADLTLNFDKFTIDLLKDQFKIRNWSMNLIQFICVVRQHLTSWQIDLLNRNFKLVRCLTLLFKEIDINCNGVLQWDQFTNYVIEKATVLKNLKSKNQQIKSYTKLNIKPKRKFDSPISKSVYIKQIQKLAIFEQGSNTIMFMDINTGEFLAKNLVINPKQLVVNMSIVKKGNEGKIQMKKKDLVISTQTRVLDILYISQEKYKILVTSTSDGYVRGWRYCGSGFTLATLPDSQQQIMQHQFTQQIYCLAWDYLNEILFCGEKEGRIFAWNLKTDTQKQLNQGSVNQDQKHTNIIMDMVSMPKLHFMASGGMDGKLILWDTINNKVKSVYKQHTRGILSVTFNETFILLFSAGFDHQICIWNPYIPTLIHKIQGHSSPILTVKVIQGTNQLISLDEQGNVKISDIRRFNIINSFSLNNLDQTQKFKPNSLTVIAKPLKLCLVGRSISIFQYDKNYNPNSADDFTTICCKYLQQSLSFYSISGNRIKIWNALTGDVQRILLDFTQGQISAFSFDTYKKRMVVGDSKGNITIYNAKNGAKLRALPKHQNQVTHILSFVHNQQDIFITAGADNCVKVIKETIDGFQQSRRLVIKKQAIITTIFYCNQSRLIIVGTNIGLLGFYQLQTGKLVGSIVQKEGQQITSINKMQNRTIITTHSSGLINVIALPPLINKFQKLYTFNHPDPQNSQKHSGILTAVYSQNLKKFFAIDDKNYLNCYDFATFYYDIQKNIEYQKNHRQGGTNRRIAQRIERPVALKTDILWSVKTHNESLKYLQYVDQTKLLITTSYDKKVKLWNAITGEYIDSLQQNYDKASAIPLAYKLKNSPEIYNLTFDEKINKQITQEQLMNIQNEFNPFFYMQSISSQKLKSFQSNEEWKLKINFKQHYQQNKNYYKHMYQEVQKNFKNVKKNTKTLHQYNSTSSLIKNKLSQKKNILKELRDIKKQVKHQSIYNQLSFSVDHKNKEKSSPKKHHMKSILSINNLLKIKSSEQVKKEFQQHQKYINNLYRKQIQSNIINQNQQKMKLSSEQAIAAQKLGKALLNLDNNDRRPLGFMNNVIVRDLKRLPRLS